MEIRAGSQNQLLSKATDFLSAWGEQALFLRKIFQEIEFSAEFKRLTFEQISSITSRSLTTVLFAGLFVGAILVVQFDVMLRTYDASILLGGITTSACIREVGPLIISFLLAGKVGAFTAAELATMKVTEQFDAIRCLGANPMRIIVVPRFIGILVSTLILLFIGLLVSTVGSVILASVVAGLNPLQYLHSMPRFASAGTLFYGFFKALAFGTAVACVSCHQGWSAGRGAKGVGRAVTMGAVHTNLWIVILDFFTSQILEALAGLFSSGGAG